MLYVLFNILLFFIEVNFFFKKNDSGNTSGFSLLDDVFTITNSSFNFLGDLALVGFSFVAMGIALVAFLLFIPLQLYYINRKYKNHKKKFLFSLLASFTIVILLKLMMYLWMFIDMNYL